MNKNYRQVLIWLLVYVVAISATIGSICILDWIPCLDTRDTRQWTMQLIAVVVALLAGNQK